MDQDEARFFEAYVDDCMHCGADPDADRDKNPQERAKCLFCDRYFQKQKLFLNNVG